MYMRHCLTYMTRRPPCRCISTKPCEVHIDRWRRSGLFDKQFVLLSVVKYSMTKWAQAAQIFEAASGCFALTRYSSELSFLRIFLPYSEYSNPNHNPNQNLTLTLLKLQFFGRLTIRKNGWLTSMTLTLNFATFKNSRLMFTNCYKFYPSFRGCRCPRTPRC